MTRLVSLPRPPAEQLPAMPPATAPHDCMVYLAPLGTYSDSVRGGVSAEWECQCCGTSITSYLGTLPAGETASGQAGSEVRHAA